MKRLLPVLAVLALCLGVMPVGAGNQNIQSYLIFAKINTTAAVDTAEHTTIWFPVRGASRVYFRCYSQGATSDTNFCDSIATWKVLMTDSMAFVARDSAGTTVTAWSTVPKVQGTHGEPYPMGADSLSISGTVIDSVKMVYSSAPVNRPLKPATSGSGSWSIVTPLNVASAFGNATPAMPENVIMTNYMKVRFTARTRLTTAGFSSTAGTRTIGIRNLRITAYVVYPNK